MKFTEELIKSKYDIFNAKFFNNELSSNIQFKAFKSKRVLAKAGNTRPLTFHYNLNVVFESEKDMNETILHEMIHFYQFQNNMYDFHGRSFKLKSMIISSLSNNEYNCSRVATSNSIKIEKKEKVSSDRLEACLFVIHPNQTSFKIVKCKDRFEVNHHYSCLKARFSFKSGFSIYYYYGTEFNSFKTTKLYTSTFNVSPTDVDTIIRLSIKVNNDIIKIF